MGKDPRSLMGEAYPLPMSLTYLEEYVPGGDGIPGRVLELVSALEDGGEELIVPDWALPGFTNWLFRHQDGQQLQATNALWDYPVAKGRSRSSLVSLPTIAWIAREMGLEDHVSAAAMLFTYGDPDIYGVESEMYREAFQHETLMTADVARGTWAHESSVLTGLELRAARLRNIEGGIARGHYDNDVLYALMIQAVNDLVWHVAHGFEYIQRYEMPQLLQIDGYYTRLLEIMRGAKLNTALFNGVLAQARAMYSLNL